MAIASRQYGLPDWIGVVLAWASGVLVGLINSILAIRRAVPSVIATPSASRW